MRSARASDLLLGHDEWGASWIAAHRARLAAAAWTQPRWTCRGGRRGVSGAAPQRAARLREAARDVEAELAARRRRRACPPEVPARRRRVPRAERHAGVRRRQLERDRDRLDLRRLRHLQEVQGAGRLRVELPVGSVDPRAFTRGRAGGRLAAGLPRDGARGPGRRGAAAADAAQGRAGRRRPPRDPAPVGAEAPRRAGGADARGSAPGPAAGARRDRRPRADRARSSCCACSAGCCARPAST